MMQRTTVEIVLTTEEALKYQQTIHRAICLLNELGPTIGVPEKSDPFTLTQVRADLLKLAAKLGDAPVVGVREFEVVPLADPFTPEGNGSAEDVLLGRLVSICNLVLGSLAWSAARPEERTIFRRTQQALMRDWHEYEELSRG